MIEDKPMSGTYSHEIKPNSRLRKPVRSTLRRVAKDKISLTMIDNSPSTGGKVGTTMTLHDFRNFAQFLLAVSDLFGSEIELEASNDNEASTSPGLERS